MHSALFTLALVGATCAALGFAVDPDGVGAVVFAMVSAVFIVVITVTPLLRGVRPRRIWMFQP